ncbi:NYN domain-containing protein [soil metagenome]
MVSRWVVDAMNVVGCRPDGWWRDRTGAVAGLVEEIVHWRELTGEPVLVVVDGFGSERLDSGTHLGVHVLFVETAAPDAADDRIAALVGRHPEPSTLRVVTSDGDLADRARAAGATVEGAAAFRRRLQDAAGSRS